MKFKTGQWVVCLHVDLSPATWGKVADSGVASSYVEYGEDAPTWESPYWENDHLKPVESEEAARKIVEDHEASIDYDPR
jgi:hypothetical protein